MRAFILDAEAAVNAALRSHLTQATLKHEDHRAVSNGKWYAPNVCRRLSLMAAPDREIDVITLALIPACSPEEKEKRLPRMS